MASIRKVTILTTSCLMFVALLIANYNHYPASTTTVTTNHRRGLRLIAFGEDNNLPPLTAYKQAFVCLDTDFSRDGVATCTADDLISFTADENPTGTQFRYHNHGPDATKGVFWLSDLGTSDSLLTFAETPRVGGYVSRGMFQRDPQGFHYRLRVRGDRTWSFADKDYIGVGSKFDSTLLFQLVRGTIDAPTKFVIDGLRNYFGILPFRFYMAWWFRIFNYNIMTLVTDPNHPMKVDFPDSTLWHRQSYLLFIINVLDYYAIQIVDGNGDKIDDAYDAWVRYQQTDRTGSDPNWNHFDYLPDDYTG